MGKKFVADAMLGKLAKWLRVMGYDVRYQSHYPSGLIDRLVRNEARTLLSRRLKTVAGYQDAFLITADSVREQLLEMKIRGLLTLGRSSWFTRCLRCNTLLKEATLEEASFNIPDYVLNEKVGKISVCPSCGRYYWPGTHRVRMEKQLEEWGF
ncbi:MAG: hypothetical protein DRH11_09340 [Deltaproteobacteria bacterium]|nr:hypothetical protein [Deltaproteobacteria bacterium]MBW1935551.1 hypothetical protein [Deltaproteobacteria bacterium]RLB33298.1 MAG: hypothetical protein DRH11_09340 [Deltaproteobacteria bacterium]